MSNNVDLRCPEILNCPSWLREENKIVLCPSEQIFALPNRKIMAIPSLSGHSIIVLAIKNYPRIRAIPKTLYWINICECCN
jgi:hypothetical protein